jgi:1,4-dihydroxy-2-naphthoate octaprenyltransferase
MSSAVQAPRGLKLWLVAVRPFAYTASVTAVLLGLALAYHAAQPIRWGLFALTLVGVVCFHTGANLLNDCFDYARGLDNEVRRFSGAVVRGWLTRRQVFRAALVFLGVGTLCGLVLVWAAGWVVLLLGAVGALIAAGYTGPRVCFKYAGLGDPAIFLAFGVLPVFGTFWVQARTWDASPLLWSVPLAMITVAILHSNNWRDIQSDAARRCRTLAGALGESGSAGYYHVLILGPFVLTGLFLLGRLALGVPAAAPLTVLAVVLALPKAMQLLRVGRDSDPERFDTLDGLTAQLQLAFGLLLSAAFFAGKHLPWA